MLAFSALGWDVTMETVIVGAMTGLTYAILAAGLVLVYRATRVINFAHGEIGAFGAALLGKLVIDQHWNYWMAFAAMLVVGAAVGGIVELVVIRRLFRAPRLILLVASIGVAQLVFVGQLLLPGIENATRYPSPFRGTATIGDLVLTSAHFMVLAAVPLVIVGLALLLGRTPYGIAIRASAENGDAAELAGISTRRVSTMVWVLAGVLSTLTAILINPLRGTIVGIPSQAIGPGLLLRALVPALVGRMTSLPLTLVGGIATGVVEALVFANVTDPGIADAVLFVAVLVLVLVRRGSVGEDRGSWSLSPRVRAIPETLRGVWWVPRLNQLVAVAGLAIALLLPVVFDDQSQAFLFSRVLLFGIVALSVTVLTGWGGQLSLGQVAFVGLGSMVTAALHARGVSFGVAVVCATACGVFASLLIGFPALRVQGLFLAVTTLAFAVMARGWLLGEEVFLGDSSSVFVPRGEILGVDLGSQRTYYYFCLAVLVGCVALVVRLRRTGVGRTIVAVRENDASAAGFGVSPTVAKLSAFMVSGGLAALAGGMLAGLRVQFGPADFGPEESLQAVAMTVIGGLGSIGGSLVGAAYVVGLPALFGHNRNVALATSGIGLLVLLLYLPGGLAEVAYRARDWLLRRASRRAERSGVAAAPAGPVARPAVARNGSRPPVPVHVPAVRADGITVRYGGRVALDGVTVEARPGEVVGLIGSNGAGKSTLMNVVSGFVPAQAGTVEVFGVDVSGMPPYVRAGLGMGRVFQDARLFGDLTVRDTVKVALESHERAELVPSLLGLPPSLRSERWKAAEAEEYVHWLGLGRYADSFISDLSTGTRRIVELCCLVAQGGRLLLLDEPTAGVAQRETEAFGPLIKQIQAELDASVVIIEHDIPLMMSISDRVYCLAAGQVIAEGLPDAVRNDPAVIAAYLGTDERAIERSGVSGNGRARATGRKRRPAAAASTKGKA